MILTISYNLCTLCGMCEDVCPFDAIETKNTQVVIYSNKCTLCKICVKKCPTGALYIKNDY